jgi:D-alanyl-D-alanine carboxypeptidase-like protein
VLGAFAVPAMVVALAPGFQSSVQPLPQPVQTQLKAAGVWHRGCPVGLSDLRLLTVSHRDFRGRTRTGQLVVNKSATAPLRRVFRRLYALRFPIRHLTLADAYAPEAQRPNDGDISGSFECRQAVPSPCTGGRGTGTWSMHAFGLAVDINPVENPYVGPWGVSPPNGKTFVRRKPLRRGMLSFHDRAWWAFHAIGWEWGGSWSWPRDYQHFSATNR